MKLLFVGIILLASNLASAADCLNLEKVKVDLIAAAKTRAKANRTELTDVKIVNAFVTPEKLGQIVDQLLMPVKFLNGVEKGDIKQIECDSIEIAAGELILDITNYTDKSLELSYNIAGLRAFSDRTAERSLAAAIEELAKATKKQPIEKISMKKGESLEEFLERATSELSGEVLSQVGKLMLEKYSDPVQRKVMIEQVSDQMFDMLSNTKVKITKLSPTRYEVKQEQSAGNDGSIIKTEITAADDDVIQTSPLLVGLKEIAAKKAANAK